MNPAIATQRILFAIARRIGLEPLGDDANLGVTKTREILGFMDERLREGWELYDFLETTEVEERAFCDDYDPLLCYQAGVTVWDPCSRLYYQSLVPTQGGPLANPAVWQTNAQPYPRWVPWRQKGKHRIGTCFTAWNKNPYENQNRVPIPFLLSERGLEFSLSQVVSTIWLQYRHSYPGIALDAWDAADIYNEGDAAYYNMDTYISRIDNNVNNTPPLEWDDNWRRFRIPWVFRQFVTQAAFSDTLIVNGQNEKAPAELNAAYTALNQEFDKQTIQSGQFTGYSARVV